MFKTAAILAMAVLALGSTQPLSAHDRHDHRGDRHASDWDDRRYRDGHRFRADRRFERRLNRRAERRFHRRHARQFGWVRDHERFLYNGRALRHRHHRGGWHWHRAPRYRFHPAGHVCDLRGRHRHDGIWFFGTAEAYLASVLAYELVASYYD